MVHVHINNATAYFCRVMIVVVITTTDHISDTHFVLFWP